MSAGWCLVRPAPGHATSEPAIQRARTTREDDDPRMTTSRSPEEQQRLLQRAIGVVRVAVVAWSAVVLCAIALIALKDPRWLWALLALLGAYRLVRDIRRLRELRSRLAEELDGPD